MNILLLRVTLTSELAIKTFLSASNRTRPFGAAETSNPGAVHNGPVPVLTAWARSVLKAIPLIASGPEACASEL